MSQLLLGVTPGPRQPADLESFLDPIAEELNLLAAGVPGMTVAGFDEPRTIQGLVVQFTADMPAGDKLLNAIGENGEYPCRFRIFAGVLTRTRYYYPSFDPPYDPQHPSPAKRRRFDVKGNTKPRRTAASVAASATRVKDARTSR